MSAMHMHGAYDKIIDIKISGSSLKIETFSYF